MRSVSSGTGGTRDVNGPPVPTGGPPWFVSKRAGRRIGAIFAAAADVTRKQRHVGTLKLAVALPIKDAAPNSIGRAARRTSSPAGREPSRVRRAPVLNVLGRS